MTLEAWVRPTSLGSVWRPVIVKQRGDSFSYDLYAHDDAGRPAGYARTSADYGARGTSALPISSWSHVAVTYDGTTLRFFLNGVQKGSRTVGGSLAVGSGTLKIGGSSTWKEWFKGDMDDVRIWRKPLTVAQIQADMQVDG
jgi:hypothetical protein